MFVFFKGHYLCPNAFFLLKKIALRLHWLVLYLTSVTMKYTAIGPHSKVLLLLFLREGRLQVSIISPKTILCDK